MPQRTRKIATRPLTNKKGLRVKTNSIAIRAIFLSISLTSCAKVPPFPEVFQCGYSIKFDKFRCCNTKTKECVNLRRDDASMEAAQCLSADDYKKSEAWVQEVINIANQGCK